MDRGRFFAGRRIGGGGRRGAWPSNSGGNNARAAGSAGRPSFNGAASSTAWPSRARLARSMARKSGCARLARASRLMSSTSARSSSVHGLVVGGCASGAGRSASESPRARTTSSPISLPNCAAADLPRPRPRPRAIFFHWPTAAARARRHRLTMVARFLQLLGRSDAATAQSPPMRPERQNERVAPRRRRLTMLLSGETGAFTAV